jgi:GAF domain-containing protein
MTSTRIHLQQMKALRDTAGARSVLIYLNELAPHRFSAMFRFEGSRLKSVCFYDRERPELDSCPEIPITTSYCVFVRNSEQTFSTVDSHTDNRVTGHPKQFEIRSYVGVPLLDVSGEMFGTICHFDMLPQTINSQNIELMEAVGTILDPSRQGLAFVFNAD